MGGFYFIMGSLQKERGSFFVVALRNPNSNPIIILRLSMGKLNKNVREVA
jgi:hypothetical protein